MAQAQPHDTRSDFERNRQSFVLDLDYRGRSKATATSYCKAIDLFAAHLAATGGPLTVAEVTPDHVRGWLAQLRADGQAPATCAVRYRSLQAWFKFLAKEGRVSASPFATLEPPRVVPQPPPVLATGDIQALLKATSGTTFVDRRDHAILALFIETGARLGELTGLRKDDVDLARHTIYVTGKGNRERVVQFGTDAARYLDRYLYARDRHPDAESEWLWLGQRGRLTETGIDQMVKRRAREAGLTGVHPHLFRHTAAHRYLAGIGSADGMSEGDLMSNMGWRSRQMLDRYGASAKAERARAAQRRHSILDHLRDAR